MTGTRDLCREWRLLASCELDGELSELGAARLRHHLAECADCSVWAAEAGQLTQLLRAAEHAPFERQIQLPALRRRLYRASGLVGAGASAAAAALAAVLVGFPAGTGPNRSTLPEGVPAVAAGAGCISCAGSDVVLTAFKHASLAPRPSGVENPSVEIE
jgi:predicted anti-sigma-YlaC factor YlaD